VVGRGDLKVGLYLAKNALRKRRETGAIEREQRTRRQRKREQKERERNRKK